MGISEGYPECILPRAAYKLDMNMPVVLDAEPEVIIQRRCDKSFEECCKDGNPEDVRLEAFGEYLYCMSVNLLGGLFELGHVRWKTTGAGAKYWKTREDIKLDDYKESCVPHPYGHALYFNASQLEGINFDVPYVVKDKGLRKKFGKAIKAAFEGKGERFEATIRIKHAPTKLNYWHVEVWQNVENGEEVTSVKKTSPEWKEKTIESFCSRMRDLATLREPTTYSTIAESYYV